MGLFHIYVAFVPEFIALQTMSATKANILYATTPFIAACFAYVLHAERLTIKKVAGIVVALISVLPILFNAQTHWLEAISGSDLLLGIAIISSVYGWFLVSQLMDKGYSLVIINGVAMICGGIGALLTSYCTEPMGYTAVWHYPFWGWLCVLIVSANIVVYNLYVWLCKRYSITFISSAGFLCPVFGWLFGWWLDGDGITRYYLISLVGIMIGLWLYCKDEALSSA